MVNSARYDPATCSEDHDEGDFHGNERHASKPHGKHQVASAHGRGEQALEQLTHTHVHDDPGHAPHGSGHEVHGQKAGNEKVDVARARLVHFFVAHQARLDLAGCALEDLIHRRARLAGFGSRRIETIGDGLLWRLRRHEQKVHASGPQLGFRAGGVERLHLNLGSFEYVLKVGRDARQGADDGWLGAAHAEGDAKGDGQQHRKPESPEKDTRLAANLPQARERELKDGIRTFARLSHRANAFL
jgi:hypothetical protein